VLSEKFSTDEFKNTLACTENRDQTYKCSTITNRPAPFVVEKVPKLQAVQEVAPVR
jgi:hypothetical protein